MKKYLMFLGLAVCSMCASYAQAPAQSNENQGKPSVSEGAKEQSTQTQQSQSAPASFGESGIVLNGISFTTDGAPMPLIVRLKGQSDCTVIARVARLANPPSYLKSLDPKYAQIVGEVLYGCVDASSQTNASKRLALLTDDEMNPKGIALSSFGNKLEQGRQVKIIWLDTQPGKK